MIDSTLSYQDVNREIEKVNSMLERALTPVVSAFLLTQNPCCPKHGRGFEIGCGIALICPECESERIHG